MNDQIQTTRITEEKKKVKSRRLPKSIRPEEFVDLIKSIPKKNLKVKIAFLLGYGAGMRVSEVVRCSKEHFRETSIFIPESKYGVERVVPIPKGWRDEFTKLLPLGISVRMLQHYFIKYKKLSKINQEHSFHSLRHGFGTRLTESGVPLNQVSLLLGHANLSTTSVYTKAAPMDALKSYEEYF